MSRPGRVVLGRVISVLRLTVVVAGVSATVAMLLPGVSASVVSSGSMEPSLRTGDVVIHRTTAITALAVGDIVVFDSGTGSTVHRVITVDPDRAVTRGDANAVADSIGVTDARLRGRVVAVMPWIGWFRLWLAGSGWPLLIGAAALWRLSGRRARPIVAPPIASTQP